ncbi:MAG: hypothetical protein EAZ92_11650 [Candidatus Kapaibacterium sp.]|nr:MAG: hypothetical protein EAZ92_11650 [Candidatus Kapabacteria bacterium]
MQVPVVVIELEGAITLTPWKEQYVETSVTTKLNGNVWGWSNRTERPPYNILPKQVGDTLCIRAAARPRLWTIGIATLTETNTHNILIPQSAKVIVRSNETSLQIQGMFRDVDITTTKGITNLFITEPQLRFLQVRSSTILVNTNLFEKTFFTRENKGNALYVVENKHGEVHILLTN